MVSAARKWNSYWPCIYIDLFPPVCATLHLCLLSQNCSVTCAQFLRAGEYFVKREKRNRNFWNHAKCAIHCASTPFPTCAPIVVLWQFPHPLALVLLVTISIVTLFYVHSGSELNPDVLFRGALFAVGGK